MKSFGREVNAIGKTQVMEIGIVPADKFQCIGIHYKQLDIYLVSRCKIESVT